MARLLISTTRSGFSDGFSTWLRPLQADVISQDQVVLYASNMFVKSWVENHYLAQIHQICQALAKKSKFTNYRKRRGKTGSKSC